MGLELWLWSKFYCHIFLLYAIQSLFYYYIAFPASISALATQRCKNTCSEFIGTGSGFSAVIELDKQDVVFFSVPYDEGFTIKVNGVKQTPIKANLSFMGIVCPQGCNHIEATYRTPLLREGIILSTIAFVLLISFIVIYNNKKPNKKE